MIARRGKGLPAATRWATAEKHGAERPSVFDGVSARTPWRRPPVGTCLAAALLVAALGACAPSGTASPPATTTNEARLVPATVTSPEGSFTAAPALASAAAPPTHSADVPETDAPDVPTLVARMREFSIMHPTARLSTSLSSATGTARYEEWIVPGGTRREYAATSDVTPGLVEVRTVGETRRHDPVADQWVRIQSASRAPGGSSVVADRVLGNAGPDAVADLGETEAGRRSIRVGGGGAITTTAVVVASTGEILGFDQHTAAFGGGVTVRVDAIDYEPPPTDVLDLAPPAGRHWDEDVHLPAGGGPPVSTPAGEALEIDALRSRLPFALSTAGPGAQWDLMEARLATSPSGVPSAVLLYGTGGTAKVRVDESRADDAAGAAVATMSRSGAGVRIGQNDGALVPFGDDAWMLVWVDGATSVSVRSVSSGVSSADLLAFGETLR